MADDRDRFERIYRENFRIVLRFALARTSPDRATDVVAETFLVAWRRLDDVPAEARPWLLGVARRVIAGQFRSEARRAALAVRLRVAQPEGSGSPDLAAALADREEVLMAFAALGERDQEVLRLVAWDGLSAAEAAEVLNVTRLAFAVRLHRARRRLGQALGSEPRSSSSQATGRRHVDAHS
jgi:RNA polymerase sigma-70 factor (ECF subfamily)